MFYNFNIDKYLTYIIVYAIVYTLVLNDLLSHANFKEITNFSSIYVVITVKQVMVIITYMHAKNIGTKSGIVALKLKNI